VNQYYKQVLNESKHGNADRNNPMNLIQS